MKILVLIFLMFLGVRAFAFPEMVRAGYQNCTACHVSPSGGGALTEYGRSMTNELLSTWGYKGEEDFGHGAIHEMPKWLTVGGDVRWLRTRFKFNDSISGEHFFMEKDIEPVIKIDKLVVVGAFGNGGGPEDNPQEGKFISKEHYALYSFTDEVYARAGKYQVPFGILQPNHEVVTRMGLGFDEAHETYNVEAGYIGEKINAILSLDLGRFDSADHNKDGNGISVNVASNIKESYKVGLSGFSGIEQSDDKLSESRRQIFGPYGILGFTKKLVLLSEAYMLWSHPSDDISTSGPVLYNRLQYEFSKGVNGYVESQFEKQTKGSVVSETSALSLGFNFYPRPHFEILGLVGKIRSLDTDSKYGDQAWGQLHYYF